MENVINYYSSSAFSPCKSHAFKQLSSNKLITGKITVKIVRWVHA